MQCAAWHGLIPHLCICDSNGVHFLFLGGGCREVQSSGIPFNGATLYILKYRIVVWLHGMGWVLRTPGEQHLVMVAAAAGKHVRKLKGMAAGAAHPRAGLGVDP